MKKFKRICGNKRRVNLMLCMGLAFFAFFSFFPYKSYAEENLVVVIDPGHGGPGTEDVTELGARYNDREEKDLTLSIAKGMRQELSKYGNVTVYMTRMSDTALSLQQRADYAASVGADLIVSLHLNASDNHKSFGSEVWVSAFGENYAVGRGIAVSVMKRLTGLGLADRGIKTKLGSKGADYYGIIRHGAEYGIPTVIIEHGCMDSKDWEYLDTPGKLNRLGVLDAAAVAEYYGLKEGETLMAAGPAQAPDAPQSPVMPDTSPPEQVRLSLESFDAVRGIAHLKLAARESESRLMYYCYSTKGAESEDEEDWSEYFLWDSDENEIEVQIDAGTDFSGKIAVKVLNNYDHAALSNEVGVGEKPEQEELIGSAREALDHMGEVPSKDAPEDSPQEAPEEKQETPAAASEESDRDGQEPPAAAAEPVAEGNSETDVQSESKEDVDENPYGYSREREALKWMVVFTALMATGSLTFVLLRLSPRSKRRRKRKR